MVQVNITKIFGECFIENPEAALSMARVLSRLPLAERESAIHQLAMGTGVPLTFWRKQLEGLRGSKKK